MFTGLSSTKSTRSPARPEPGPKAGSGARGSAAVSGKGNSTQNWLPSPSTLTTPSLPPMSRTKSWLIDKPSPVPPYRRVMDWSPCVKGWKRRA